MPDRFDLHLGDCLEVMPTLAADSVDSIVTDPPYGLSFMGKNWDHGVPGQSFWAEALRVAKPGAHLLAFGGTRTYHRLACAIEDAGWEIRDCVMWVYGSGFPKSLDVSKAIDKVNGNATAWQTFSKAYARAVSESPLTHSDIDKALGVKSSSCYWARLDHRGGMPPRQHWEKVRDLLGLPDSFVALYDEAEREIVGEKSSGLSGGTGHTVGRFTDSRNDRGLVDITAPATEAAKQWQGWGTALKPAYEPIIVARKPLEGTVATNVLKHGTGALNVDGCRVEGSPPSVPQPVFNSPTGRTYGMKTGEGRNGEMSQAAGRWPANFIHDGSDEVVGLFPVTKERGNKSESISSGNRRQQDDYGLRAVSCGADKNHGNPGESGSAARFFYCAKASKADRDEGLEGFALRSASECCEDREPGSAGLDNPRAGAGRTSGARNIHPTVKPTSLMRYLCRLVTPPNGIILDPFMGSGSTGKGAMLEGFRFIGIEREAEYLEIARARIDAATKSDNALPLFQEELACV
jgi:DNA modification methylase